MDKQFIIELPDITRHLNKMPSCSKSRLPLLNNMPNYESNKIPKFDIQTILLILIIGYLVYNLFMKYYTENFSTNRKVKKNS